MRCVIGGRSDLAALSATTECSDAQTKEAEDESGLPREDFKSLVQRVLADIVDAHDRSVEELRHQLSSLSLDDFPHDDSSSVEESTFEEGTLQQEHPVVQEAGRTSCSSIDTVKLPPLACGDTCAPDNSFGSILPGAPNHNFVQSSSGPTGSEQMPSGLKDTARGGGPADCGDAPTLKHAQSNPVDRRLNDASKKRSQMPCRAAQIARRRGGLGEHVSANKALREAEEKGLLSTNGRQFMNGSALQTECLPTESQSQSSGVGTSEILEHSTMPRWQWMHRTGWRDYNQEEIAHLERSFQSGGSKVRLKSGKQGHHPMEIFFADMLQHNCSSRRVRSVRRRGPDAWWQRLRRFCLSFVRSWETGRPRMESFEQFYHYDFRSTRTMNFCDERGRAIKNQYTFHSNVHEMDHSESQPNRCKQFSDSNIFTFFMTVMIVLNAIWIAIETDFNDADNLFESDRIFIVVENTFCVLFTMEMTVRFLSFAKKFRAAFDTWFLFDSVCTISMIVEIWLGPFIWWLFGQGSPDRWSFILFRLARILRVTRIGRLVRIIPDVITLLSGLCQSLKPVMVSTTLLGMFVLLFAILFRNQVKGEKLGSCCLDNTEDCDPCDGYFHSIPETVLTLLFNGTLLDSVKKVIDEIRLHSSFLTFAFTLYIFITNCAVLNLLIGIICGVVQEVKEKEKVRTDKFRLMSQLSDIMRVYDKDGSGQLSKEEFDLFITNPEVKHVMTEFQVDVWGLRTFMDVYAESLFQDCEECPSEEKVAFLFEDILDIVLRLRGGGGASVSDIFNLQRFTGQRLDNVESKLHEYYKSLGCNLERVIGPASSRGTRKSATRPRTNLYENH